jgi:hypothetical protein
MGTQERRAALGSMLLAPFGLAALAGSAEAAAPKPAGEGAMNAAQRLDRLESHQQICDILYRYARGWDRLDEEALRSCFWPDSLHEHSSFKGKSQDFISKAFPYIGTIMETMHRISNMTIEIDGDRAISECYFAAHHRRPNAAKTDEEDYFLWGRYLDKFLRRDGVWKIIYRHGLNDTERVMPRADPALSKAPASQLSSRKPNDPLYALMADFHAGR